MAALTRIFNNQIYNSTIIGYQKIAAGTITGSLFASNVTVPGDLLISGNLFVLGSSSYTTIASTNTYVNDPLILMNNGFSGSNSYDEGLIFNRGTDQNQAIIWSEAFDEFRLIATNETGTTYGNINATGLARLSVGSFNVPGTANIGTLAVTGAISGASLNVSGNVLASTVGASFLTASTVAVGNIAAVTVGNVGTQFNGAAVNLSGNILSAGAVHNSLTVNGNESVTGYLNVTGNVMAAVITASQLNTTGNVLATAGVFNGLTVNGNEAVTGYLNVTGNVMTAQLNAGQVNTTGNVLATAGVFNGLTVNGNEAVTGYLNVTGNIMGAAGILNGLTVNGNEIVTGYLDVTGNVLATTVLAQLVTADDATFGNVAAGFIGNTGTAYTGASINLSGNVLAAAGVYNALTVNGNESVTGYLNVTGNVLAAAGVYNALTVNGNESVTGYLNVTGNVMTAQLNVGQINTTGNVLATAGTFNALTVNGNESVTGYLNVTGNILGAAGTLSSLTVNGNESVTGYLNVTGNILGATGTLGVLGVNNSLWANASIATTAQGIGAIVVPNGGISVAGAANIAGAITTAGAAQFNNTVTVGGIEYITNTTNATEGTGSSGALQIKGGASIARDLHIGGNLYASNIFTTTYQVITVQDPLLYLDAANTYPYNFDIGFYSNFVGPNPIDDTGNVYQHTGVVRDDTDNTWKFFSNVRTEPSGSAITFDTNTIYDPVKAGNLQLTYTQAATSTTTGALQVAGGAGIAGTVVAGQINSTGNVLGQAGTFNALTVNGNESVTGYLNVTGNVLTASLSTGQINTTGNVLATAGTFNALTVNGNESVTGYLNVTGNIIGAAGTLSGLTVNGNESITGYLNVTGNVIASAGTFNGLTVNGATTQNGTLTVSSGFINSSGNILATAGTFNSLTVNGNESVTGYLNVTGNVMAAVITASQLNSTGNIEAQNGVLNGLTVNGNESVTGYLNVTGNIMGAVGTLSGLTVNGNESVTGYLNVTGNIIGAAGTLSSLTVNGVVNSTGNVLATGGVFNGLTVNGNESITGYLNVTGNVITAQVNADIVAATGTIWANASVVTNGLGVGALVAPNGGASFNGNIIANENVFAGPDAFNKAVGLQAITFAGVDANQYYVQSALRNLDNRGSADFVAYGSSGADSDGWADFGFTGNAFADPSYTITGPDDGYFIVRPDVGGGNLVLATSETGVFNDIVLGVGSFLSTAEVARFHGNVGSSGNAWIKYQTVSTTPNNGALRVDGGVGIRGNIRVGGGAVINNSQTADPFQVKGVATTSLIYADTAQGAVIIGGSNVAPQLGSTLKINGTDSMLLPIGSTGQRPGATGNIDLAGMIRFNTTIQNMEFYDGTQWQTAGSVFTVISDRQFTGNVGGGYGNVDGTNKNFTIQANSTTSGTIVSINGVIQFPTLAYDVSGTTLTFTEAPAPDDVIDVRVLATTSTIGALANGNGLNQVIAGNDGVQIWTGTSATVERVLVNQAGDVNLLDNNKLTYTQTATNIVANNTPYVIATFSTASYTSAKYLISAKKGATNVQTMEAVVATDGTSAYLTTYGIVNNGTDMGGLSANVVSGNVRIYFTTTSNMTNANVKAFGTYIV